MVLSSTQMKNYELVVIYRPELESKKDDLQKELEQLIVKEGMKVASVAWWGKKLLSYPIKKYNEGLYLFIECVGSGSGNKAIVSSLRANDNIIRNLLVVKESA